MLHDVYIVSNNVDCATEAEMAAAETVLGTSYPEGYRNSMATFGAGQLNDRIRVLAPPGLR